MKDNSGSHDTWWNKNTHEMTWWRQRRYARNVLLIALFAASGFVLYSLLKNASSSPGNTIEVDVKPFYADLQSQEIGYGQPSSNVILPKSNEEVARERAIQSASQINKVSSQQMPLPIMPPLDQEYGGPRPDPLTPEQLEVLDGPWITNSKLGWQTLQDKVDTPDNSKSDDKTAVRRLPQAINIGAKKCGTATLKKFVNINPYIRAYEGEGHFFSETNRYYKGLPFLQELMPLSTPDQVTIEGTPRYFTTPEAAERVKALNSSMKLILIVRDPVIRLISDYAHIKNKTGLPKLMKFMSPKRIQELTWKNGGKKFPSFDWLMFDKDGNVDETLYLVQTSMYDVHLAVWLQHFPRSQIHVVDGDEMQKHPWLELQKIERFLEIPRVVTKNDFVYSPEKKFYCQNVDGVAKCMQATKGRPHPKVSAETMKKLRDFYRPHNEKFFKMIGERFGWGDN